MTQFKNDPDGIRLPIKIDSTSNGEYEPTPLDAVNRAGNEAAMVSADTHAKKHGLSRRAFQASAMGAASALLSFNGVNAAAGRTGGRFELADAAATDADVAADALSKKEFIFDVQGHFIAARDKWKDGMPQLGPQRDGCGAGFGSEGGACVSENDFIHDVFMDSDTDLMVLSFVPSTYDKEPVTIAEADAVRRIIDGMEGTKRLILHGRVNPNQDGDIERMPELAERWGIAAWKCYTQWGPDGKGFWMTDDVGVRMCEEAMRLGVKTICIHKGLSFGEESFEHSRCDEMGKIAKMFPEINFLIYHSGLERAQPEEAFAEGAGKAGFDALIQSLMDNGVGHGSNVYAELGSTWRLLMQDMNQAAHGMGKLLKYVGPDNILWGTDSIWYGSPQDQIQAFRTFQISEELQEAHGYPAITPEIRAKIFGLNAARVYGIDAEEIKLRAGADVISQRKLAYADEADPHFRTYGPKNRREFLKLLDWQGGPV